MKQGLGADAMTLASAPNAVMLYNVGDATACDAMPCDARHRFMKQRGEVALDDLGYSLRLLSKAV